MTLIYEIKNNPNMRKIFGKKEIEIVEKQLLGVPLKPSEKTRLSRDIKKKFDAIKKLSLYENQLEIKKGSEIKRVVKNAKQDILENKEIKTIFLFGSTVDKTRTLNSDIDIAVEFNKIDKKQAILFRKNILGKVDEKIDILVYNTLPDKIKKEIKNKGMIIWKKE